jgi:hypothetical protein
MRVLTAGLAGLAMTGCIELATPAPAGAAASPAYGRRCAFVATRDPRSASRDIVKVDAGPLLAADPGATISVTCTLQFGWASATHAGADALVVSSDPGSPGVTAIPPTLRAMPDGDGPIFWCTQLSVDGVTYYGDASYVEPPGTRWSTDPGVACDEVICQEDGCGPPGPVEPIREFLEESVLAALDPAACPVLATLAPGAVGIVAIAPDGDIRFGEADGLLLWDCPDGAR